MMNRLFLITMLVLTLTLETSCQQQALTYDYLLLHPGLLQQEAARCQLHRSASCVAVERASNDLGDLIYESNNDPEAFGQHIMQVQRQWASLLLKYKEAKKSNDPRRIAMAEKAYADKTHELQVLYAVMALSSPE